MTQRPSSGPDRVLICGPVFPPGTVGGLPVALEELAASLRVHGWDVDLAVTRQVLGGEEARITDAPALLPAWSRRPSPWATLARTLPSDLRTFLQHLLLGGGVARAQSDAMYAIERRLAERSYRAVIAYVSRESPGLARCVTRHHPHVLLLSLNGLASERRLARWMWAPRLVARLVPKRLHPDTYRAVPVDRIRMAVFGSASWRDEAVAAGVAPDVTRVIHFGMAAPEPLGPPRAAGGRLLWVGRCSPEKGLHLFLEAVALVRRTQPVTLTAVCGPGPASYRALIEERIVRLGLHDVVTLLPPVPRRDLQTHYREHDLLLFQSVFLEPVALVLMEAYGAGIPVVAPMPAGPSVLVAPDRTCICYRAPDPADVASAILRALADGPLRLRVRNAAHALVAGDFSLEAMGQSYDRALRELVEFTAGGDPGVTT